MQHLRDAVQHGGDRERLVTDEVRASFDETPDPRTREVLQALVAHLHAFARDVRLTEQEWTQAIEFLTRVGHITDDRRQEFILLSDVLGLSMLTVAINATDDPERHRVDRLRPVLRRGLARDPDRRRHRRGRQRRAVLGRGPRHRHPRRHRSRAPGSRSGRPTTRASTTSSRARRSPAARTSSPTTTAATASGRSSPRPTRSPTTARSATCSRPRNAARTGPRTSISWSATRAMRRSSPTSSSQGSDHLDDDAVFGVKESLIAPAEQQPPGEGPGGRTLDAPWWRMTFDLRLACA